MNLRFLPSVKFDGKIDSVSCNDKIANEIFKQANPIEYSIDYYLIHVSCDNLKEVAIEEVRGIYALDDESYRIGLDFDPPIILHEPIWQSQFNEFQIKTSVQNAQLGVSYIGEKLFGVDKLKLKNIKEKEQKDLLYEVFRELYFDERPSGNQPIWVYLLRYERHQNYPKDVKGYFLDAIHVYGNFSKKTELDASAENTKIWSVIKSDMFYSDLKYPELIRRFEQNTEFINAVEKTAGKRFIQIAALYLILKDAFKDGVSDDMKYYGRSLYDFVQMVVRNYDKEDLRQALWLLGVTLGHENLYKYVYMKDGLEILK